MITHTDLKVQQVERVYAARHRQAPYRPKGFVVKCCVCGKTKIGKFIWAYMPTALDEAVSHTFCPNCFKNRKDALSQKWDKQKKEMPVEPPTVKQEVLEI